MRQTVKEFLQTKNIWKVLPWILLLVIFFLNVFYVARHGEALLNSDTSSEMVLADLLNEEHAFLSENWYYSTELRALDTQFVYKPALMLFPEDWHAAKTFAVACFLILLALSGVYLMRSLDLPRMAPWFATALITPVSKWYAWNVLYNSYYAPHLIVTILSLALFFHFQKGGKREKLILILLLLLSFAAGLSGVRRLMICYVPLMCACLLYALTASGKDTWKRPLFTSGAALLASLSGFVVYSNLLLPLYHVGSQEGQTWKEFSLANALKCAGDYLALFGWRQEENVISFVGVISALSLLLALSGFVAGIWILKKRETHTPSRTIATWYFFTSFLVSLLAYSQSGPYNESYWTSILPFLFLPLCVFCNDIRLTPHKILLAIFALVYTLSSARFNMKDPYVSWVPNDLGIIPVAEFIREQGYTKGIALFWDSNIITELTDGKTEMWTVRTLYSRETNNWLQKRQHETELFDSGFVLVNIADYSVENFPRDELYEYAVYADGLYVLYYFDSIDRYYEIVGEVVTG